MSRCESVLRSPHRKKPIQPILALLIVCTLGAIGAATCVAQATVEQFHTALNAKAGLTKDDLAAVERGEIVIRLLPVVDKREIAVCGVVRLRGTPDVIAKAFKESLAQQGRQSVLAIGSFSNPPTLVDVESLSLENRDIEDLKRCAVGKCEMKLSTAMIGRFDQEVNWTALDYQLQANRLFRQMLVDYVRDYQASGAAALLEYHANHSRADSLAGSFSRIKRSLVEDESVEKLNTLLLQAKANVQVAHANHSGNNPVSAGRESVIGCFEGQVSIRGFWFVVWLFS